MRTIILKRASRAFSQMHFIRQSRSIVMVALLLAAGNLSAGPTVNWVSGGPNPGESGVSKLGAGYVDGDITYEAEYHTPCGIAVDITGTTTRFACLSLTSIKLARF